MIPLLPMAIHGCKRLLYLLLKKQHFLEILDSFNYSIKVQIAFFKCRRGRLQSNHHSIPFHWQNTQRAYIPVVSVLLLNNNTGETLLYSKLKLGLVSHKKKKTKRRRTRRRRLRTHARTHAPQSCCHTICALSTRRQRPQNCDHCPASEN